MLAGCRSTPPPIQVPVKTVERRVTTLVPVSVHGDSATLRALFECDSLRNVVLRDLSEQKSKNMQTGFDFKDGLLNYNAKTEPDTVWIPADTVYIEKDIPLVIKVPQTEYRQTEWQVFFSRVGQITLLIIALWGVWKLIKQKFKQ